MKKRSILLLIFFIILAGVIVPVSVIYLNRRSKDKEQIKAESYAVGTISENNSENDAHISFADSETPNTKEEERVFNYRDVKDYSGAAVQVINDNIPFFDPDEKKLHNSFEKYSDLDDLGRCGEAFACVGPETMPIEERGAIGAIKPSGWQTIKYDFIDGKYLYNRCHLIGYQLSGENDLETNLISGTRYLNIEGMLPYENRVSEYILTTKNHVLYRVTPIFQDKNLVAAGVLMEARSVEDGGEGICFCVFAYNVQPGVIIDYLTGRSELSDSFVILDNDRSEPVDRAIGENVEYPDENKEVSYIGNKNSYRFHFPDCEGVKDMKDKNKVYFYGDRNEPIEAGYVPCGSCNP